MIERQKVKLLEKIKTISEKSNNPNHRQEATSMFGFFLRNGRLTNQMLRRGVELVGYNTDVVNPFEDGFKGVKDDRYFLYAISDGNCVKVGYSTNIRKRLRDLQVAHPLDLKCVWEQFCALDRGEAYKQEQILHEKLKRYALRGEWFDNRCLPIIYKHHVKSRDAKQDRKADKINKALDDECQSILGDIL